MKKYFFSFIKKNIIIVILAVVLQLITNVMSVIIPLSYQVLIDQIIGKQNYSLLLSYIFSIAIVFVVYMLSDLFGNQLVIKCMIDLHNGLKKKVMLQIMKADNSQVNQFNKGELITRIMQDVSNLVNIIAEYFITTIMGILMFLIMIVIIFRYSVVLGIICLIAAPTFFICSNLFGKQIEKKNIELNISTEKFLNNVDECIDARDTLKFYDCYDYQRKRYEGRLVEYLRNSRSLQYKSLFAKKIFSGLSTIFPLCILIVGARLIMKGRLSLGCLISILSCINYILMPTTILSSFIIGIKQFKVSYHRLELFFESKDEDTLGFTEKNTVVEKLKAGSIKLENVSFSYGMNQILNHVSIQIHSGEFISVVGKNGIGKSTFIELLLGKLEPQEGKIFIDDMLMEKENIAGIRRKISPVLQNEFLFDDTVANNIFFEESEDKMFLSEIRDLVGENYFYKMAGKNGAELSGGEKQKVTIARALYKKSGILVIDEGSTNFDLNSLSIVHDLLKDLKGKRTIIVIDHGMQHIDISDKVLFIDECRNIYLEPHAELMKKNPEYRELYRKSTGEG